MLTVVLDLQFELPLVQGTLQAYTDGTFTKRFNEIVVRAAAHGLHADLQVVDAGGDQERHVRVGTANLGKQFQTADPGHLKVGDNGIESLALQSHKGFLAAGGGCAVKSRRRKHQGDELRSSQLIVDGEHADNRGPT